MYEFLDNKFTFNLSLLVIIDKQEPKLPAKPHNK